MCCNEGHPGSTLYNGGTSTFSATIQTICTAAAPCYRWMQDHPLVNGVQTNPPPRRVMGPVIRGAPSTWEPNDWIIKEASGTIVTPETPIPPGYEASPAESSDWFHYLENATTAPTAPPETAPFMDPDYWPDRPPEEEPDWEQWDWEFIPEPDWERWEEEFGDDDEDGVLNPEDPDNDNDGVPDAYDPAPHDPYDPKAWLDPDFLAPSDPQQREALWGPVVGTWTTPGGGECKEFQSGAKLCDYPGGSTFVWIVRDWTAWMQSSGGEKESYAQPPAPPNSGGGSSGGGSDGEIPADHAEKIATHAYRDPDNPRYIANIEPWDIYALADYVEAIGRKEKNVVRVREMSVGDAEAMVNQFERLDREMQNEGPRSPSLE